MYKILVTGSDGQLGSELRFLSKEYKNYKYFFTDKKELDICNSSLVQKFVNHHKINVMINCAAYTAVDRAETEQELAYEINHIGIENLAIIAKKNLCKLIHISTDYIFDGTKTFPYTEEDIPNPQSIYGKSKLAGEQALKNINPDNSIIIRTSWVYANIGDNFVKTMLRLGQNRTKINVVADQMGSPTYARDLAQIIIQILPQIENKIVAIFHFTNDGVCSWADFAIEIFKIKDINCKVNPITTLEYPTPAKRPSFSVMDKRKIKEFFDLKIPNWKESLVRMLKTRKG